MWQKLAAIQTVEFEQRFQKVSKLCIKHKHSYVLTNCIKLDGEYIVDVKTVL